VIIIVEARPQYGQLRYYPTDPEVAKAYTSLTNHRTVLPEDRNALATLGITIEVIKDDSPFTNKKGRDALH
jgi:hypothetical protein